MKKEYASEYYARNKEKYREYYLKNRENIKARNKARYDSNPELSREIYLRAKTKGVPQAYYQKNKIRIADYRKQYYILHKEYIKSYLKRHTKMHVIKYGKQNRRINGVNKSPYPNNNQCSYCCQVIKILQWHHWSDDNPSDGVWLCPSCHTRISWLIRKAMDKEKTIDGLRSLFVP